MKKISAMRRVNVPATGSSGYIQARNARRFELVEDYVELIAELIASEGEARQVDIASRLSVAQPTVSKMLQRLEQEGLISRRPYRGIFLTAAGESLAAKGQERHQVVEQFLICHGIAPSTASRDAEGIEHYVSDETLEVFRRHVRMHSAASKMAK